jgi:hypothetical protein
MTFFETIQYKLQNFFSSGPGSSSYVFKIALAAFIILFFVAIILVLARYPKSIFGSDGDVLYNKDKNRGATFWNSEDPTQILVVSYADAGKNPSFNRYTIMADMIWWDTRVGTYDDTVNPPFRHVIHRGSDDAQKSLEPNSGITLNDGLPISMNPGIMVDPYKNDMIIFIDTENGDNIYRDSVRIPDIPLSEPFTLALVVQDRMLEVYVNCRLEVSKLLSGMPRSVPREIYGLAGTYPLNANIQNLRVWNTGLSVSDIRNMCKKKPVFNKASKCSP